MATIAAVLPIGGPYEDADGARCRLRILTGRVAGHAQREFVAAVRWAGA